MSNKEEVVEELNDKYLRLYAEFENYKKRVSKEKEDIKISTVYQTVSDLLDIIDDLNLAKNNGITGLDIILSKFDTYLKTQGISKIVTENEIFDPNIHECISTIEVSENKNKIIDCIRTGYKMRDKIIRFPKVIVGI